MRFLLITICVFFSLVQAVGQDKKETEFTRNFYNAAFGNVQDSYFPLSKWESVDTIRYAITGELKYMNEKKWNNFVHMVSEIIEIPIVRIQNRTKAKIKIHVAPLEAYINEYNIDVFQPLGSNFDCWFNSRKKENDQLLSAEYCIDPNRVRSHNSGLFLLKNMFLRGLGMAGQSDDPYSIYFGGYTGSNGGMSKNDKRLLKLLYHPKLSSGMKKSDVESLLDTLAIGELLKMKL